MAAHPNTPPPDPTDDLKKRAWTSLQPTPFVPMGFGSQIRALGEVQRQQANRIDALEKAVAAKDINIEALEKKVIDDIVVKDARIDLLEKDVAVKDGKIEALEKKIKAIECVNEQCAASRRAAVMYLQGLKFPLKNQEVHLSSIAKPSKQTTMRGQYLTKTRRWLLSTNARTPFHWTISKTT